VAQLKQDYELLADNAGHLYHIYHLLTVARPIIHDDLNIYFSREIAGFSYQ